MEDRQLTCCFTGHRPEQIPPQHVDAIHWRLREQIERAVRDGYTHFISGMSRGIDLYAARIVLDFKEEHPSIRLEAAVPCLGQSDRWSAEDRRVYSELLARCDVVTCLSRTYTKNCMILRNDYMVKHSARVIAYYNGSETGGTAATVKMAQRAGIELINIYGEDL